MLLATRRIALFTLLVGLALPNFVAYQISGPELQHNLGVTALSDSLDWQ